MFNAIILIVNVFLVASCIFDVIYGNAPTGSLLFLPLPLFAIFWVAYFLPKLDKKQEAFLSMQKQFAESALKLAVAAHALRRWHQSEYKSNPRIDAEFDEALTAFSEASGLEFSGPVSISDDLDPSSQTPSQDEKAPE